MRDMADMDLLREYDRSGSEEAFAVVVQRHAKLASIHELAKTVLVAETPAFLPYSWHQPGAGQRPMFNDAKAMLSFVDGHVSYLRIYWQDAPGNSMACEYNPPASYDYKWSED